MITFRCNGKCPYCILDLRGKHVPRKEMSGNEILAFWNGLEHHKSQQLSLIGGEPTLHPDIIKIVNGLKRYRITITTNCKSPFYEDPKFFKRFKPHRTSMLRINTTFHPHHITPEEYIEVVKKYRSRRFVDQISYVHTPEVVEKYRNEIIRVHKALKVKPTPYLGFYSKKEGFAAPPKPELLKPNEDSCESPLIGYLGSSKAAMLQMCDLSDMDVYREMCGQSSGSPAKCRHPILSLIVDPMGNYYHCHYKLYYEVDPVCNIKDFKPVLEPQVCHCYGLCNNCDIPRMKGCKKLEH
jgi:MoaA/NifB/PqqE/SkfB family radical SAM enzyme